MIEQSARAKLSPKLETRKARLLEQLQSLETMRLCGPSDDPEEQTAVTETYRHILIQIKILSKGLVSPETQSILDGQDPLKIEGIYDVYHSKAYLDAVASDIACDLEDITVASESVSPKHVISPVLIDALRQPKPNSFDASRLAEYCREINSGFTHGNLISCILLMRAVLNHVPPVFGHTDFSQVVANATHNLRQGRLFILFHCGWSYFLQWEQTNRRPRA
jgi:hypothetical protein